MGKMKNLYIDIVNSKRYQDASEAQRRKILEEWQQTDEYLKKIEKNKKK